MHAGGEVVVRSPGLWTTVQDLGRPGWRRAGVPVGGAADAVSLRVANLLVGNPEGAAALELTLAGPTLEFRAEGVFALCGALYDAQLDGEAVEPMRPYYAPAGAVLTVRRAVRGCRGVLALAGGVDVPAVLGSRSTYVRARLGGVAGRPLAAGDRLWTGPLPPAAERLMMRLRRQGSGGLRAARGPFAAAPGLCPAIPDPSAAEPAVIRALRGAEAARFRPHAAEGFWDAPYTVRPEADRMGARLAGPQLALPDGASMLSEAVAPGAVQVPPDGQPIVLLPDCGTTGGYPRIAHVAAVDLPLVGQLRPGDRLHFREIAPAEAERLLVEREAELVRFRLALRRWMEE